MAKHTVPSRAKAPRRATPLEDVPRRIVGPTLDDHLEIITRAIFQAGLSWAFIAARWDAFRTAFEQFAIERVARYDAFDIDRLLHAEGVVRSEKKLAATIENARTLIHIDQTFGSIDSYVAGFRTYADLLADVRGRFAFMGDLSCYYWLFRTGNPVPQFEDWLAVQSKDHPRMREMVLTGRAEGTSSERAGY